MYVYKVINLRIPCAASLTSEWTTTNWRSAPSKPQATLAMNLGQNNRRDNWKRGREQTNRGMTNNWHRFLAFFHIRQCRSWLRKIIARRRLSQVGQTGHVPLVGRWYVHTYLHPGNHIYYIYVHKYISIYIKNPNRLAV